MIKRVSIESCPICKVVVSMAVVIDKSKPTLPYEPKNLFGDLSTFDHRTQCKEGWFIHYVSEEGEHILVLATHLIKGET